MRPCSLGRARLGRFLGPRSHLTCSRHRPSLAHAPPKLSPIRAYPRRTGPRLRTPLSLPLSAPPALSHAHTHTHTHLRTPSSLSPSAPIALSHAHTPTHTHLRTPARGAGFATPTSGFAAPTCIGGWGLRLRVRERGKSERRLRQRDLTAAQTKGCIGSV